MPTVYFIKYFDGSTCDESPNKLEFFLYKEDAEQRKEEIQKQIADAGGRNKCDIYYDGGYSCFWYRDCLQLIQRLNEINEIFST